jgi:hypothetical protein
MFYLKVYLLLFGKKIKKKEKWPGSFFPGQTYPGGCAITGFPHC